MDQFLNTFFELSAEEKIMLGVGFTGQALFAMRFIIQWLKSEISRRSVIPIAFWYFSILGGATLFIYAVWRGDPCLLYTSPSPRDRTRSRMPSSA